MGSQPPCDRLARACGAETVAAGVSAAGWAGAGARWNHESLVVSSNFLIISARHSKGTSARADALRRGRLQCSLYTSNELSCMFQCLQGIDR